MHTLSKLAAFIVLIKEFGIIWISLLKGIMFQALFIHCKFCHTSVTIVLYLKREPNVHGIILTCASIHQRLNSNSSILCSGVFRIWRRGVLDGLGVCVCVCVCANKNFQPYPLVNVQEVFTGCPKVTRSLSFIVQEGWWRPDRGAHSVFDVIKAAKLVCCGLDLANNLQSLELN